MAKAHVVGQSWQRSDGGTWQVLSAGPQSATMPASEAEDGYRAEHESTVQIQDLTDITAEQEQGMDGTRLDEPTTGIHTRDQRQAQRYTDASIDRRCGKG